MEGVNTTVSTLRAPSIVAAVKDLYWRITVFNVKVMYHRNTNTIQVIKSLFS